MSAGWLEITRLETRASAADLAEDVWDNDNCCCYSSDGERLLDAENYPGEVHVKDGTKVICDEVFAFHDYMAEDRRLGEVIPDDERVSLLDKVFLPASVTHIGRAAFRECGWMKSIKLPKDLLYIAEDAFQSCWELRSLTCPAGLVAIGEGAFEDCCSLGKVKLDKALKSIGDGAFYACESLEEIVLPPSLEHIGEDAFGCTSLKRIFISPSSADRIPAMLPERLRKKVRML